MKTRQQLENDLEAASKRVRVAEESYEKLEARIHELTRQVESLILEREHDRRIWAVLEQLSVR